MNLLIALRGVDETNSQSLEKDIKEYVPELENVYYAYSKVEVQRVCLEEEIDVVLVSEHLNMRTPYSPEDLNRLDETKEELKVIPILQDEHYGTDYMLRLHSAAVYNAIFDNDAEVEKVCELINTGRGKRESRVYYGISAIKEKPIISDLENQVRSSLTYILQGKDIEERKEKTAYIHQTLPYAAFLELINKLPEELVLELKKDDTYQAFFHLEAKEEDVIKGKKEKKEKIKEPIIKKIPLTVPVPSISLVKKPILRKDSEEHIYPEEDVPKEVIGVIGIQKNSGSTFIAGCIANYFLQNTKKPVQYIEVLEESKSEECQENGYGIVCSEAVISQINNDNPIFQENKTIILDYGYLQKDNMREEAIKSFSLCTKIWVVLDAACPMDMEELRFLKNLDMPNTEIGFVINKVYEDMDISYLCDAIGDGYNLVSVPVYEQIQDKKSLNDILNGIKQCEEDNPFFKQKEKTSIFKTERTMLPPKTRKKTEYADEVKKIIVQGTTEISFLGMESGVGTTHAALLCAYSLASDYNVAYIECNDSGQILSFIEKIGVEGAEEEGVTYMGVDLYSPKYYEEFCCKYRNEYDYVIIDQGCLAEDDVFSRNEKIRTFLSFEKNILIASASPWKEERLKKFYNSMKQIENMKKAIYAMPFAVDMREKGWLDNICEENKVCTISYAPTFSMPSKDVREMFFSVLDIDRKITETNKKGVLNVKNKIFRKK